MLQGSAAHEGGLPNASCGVGDVDHVQSAVGDMDNLQSTATAEGPCCNLAQGMGNFHLLQCSAGLKGALPNALYTGKYLHLG